MKVVGLHRYPVKSLRGEQLERTDVEPIGFAGDRRWMVVNRAGRFLTIRQHPALTQVEVVTRPEGIVIRHAGHGSIAVATPRFSSPRIDVAIWHDVVPAVVADPEAGVFLARILQTEVDLVYLADKSARQIDLTYATPGEHVSFADGYPVLMTTTGSLEDLNYRLAAPIGMNRFRPNLVVSTAEGWLEDQWKVIRIGALIFRVAKPCARCVVTTRDPLTGDQADPREPLATLSSFHRASTGGAIFGQNLVPDGPGTISINDSIEILESGPSNLLRG